MNSIRGLSYQILGGENQIGGNCVYLQYGQTKLLLDIGQPLSDGQSSDKKERASRPVAAFEIPEVDYCIISHSHQDHWGFLDHLPENTIIYSGAASQTLIKISLYVSHGPNIRNEWRVFKSGEQLHLGEFTIQPFLVDHSAYDAYAFLIAAGDVHLLYTGDIRFHGRKASLSKYLPNKINVPIDLMICEGTNLSGQIDNKDTYVEDNAINLNESDLEELFASAFTQNELPAVVQVSGQNIDRLVTIYRACKKANRYLVLDPYTAFVLNRLKNSKLPQLRDFTDIRVLLPERKDLWRGVGLNRQKFTWMEQYAVTTEELKHKQNYVLIYRYWINKLLSEQDIYPDGSSFIYSMSSFYLGKMQNQWGDLSKRIDEKQILFQKIHASGHAYAENLKAFIQQINPQKISPIHTMNALWFAQFKYAKIEGERDDQ